MTVTEVALLRVNRGIDIHGQDLRARLSKAKTVMEEYTRRTFYYFNQIEDPDLIYIFGEWDSLDQHLKHFIPSDANQKLLQLLKDDVTVEWLLHLNATHADLPLPKDKNTKTNNVISIVRHFVKDSDRHRFAHTYAENRKYLQDFVTEGVIEGGWRIDEDREQEEWVLLCPWKDVAQHEAFAETEGFDKYGKIRECITGADIKHAQLLDI